ncbi:MAG TPA: OsmC family protein [Allosphingosinicella sp.]|jgi:organic hydroperoxide reductase OsmC/OhrA
MSRYCAEIDWRSDGRFSDGRYSRAHEWRFDGGQVVRGSASPGAVREPMSDPFGVDPEEALIASASSCHMLWFLDLARQDGFELVSYRDAADGEMGRIGEGRLALTRITLRPEIEVAGRPPSEAELQDLHHRAHLRCFIANSLKTEIVIEPGASR